MSIAIKVENLSKAYQIGQIGTGTLSRDIERWVVTRLLGREDPFLKLGETNHRTVKSETNVVWSLRDVNFEIRKGEAVGIIGRNGAGKSTLLKLLSRITSPTTGKIKIKGRVASLLEVGTGFHPELTGRENIYLNGSILGMRKKEIDRKLDEIIDFSGVERYIDTPVKRYSTGMSVRLAFAVAAHLESEILIVDEVLAVGDFEFQKKCLGKMEEVGQLEGRTVLFVSHNLASVKTLCDRGILLNNGEVEASSNSIDDLISRYARESLRFEDAPITEDFGIAVSEFTFFPASRRVVLGEGIEVGFRIENKSDEAASVLFNLELKNEFDQPVYCVGNEFNNFPLNLDRGEDVFVRIKISEVDLRPGVYKFKLWSEINRIYRVYSDYVSKWSFEVEESDYLSSGGKLPLLSQHGPVIKKYKKKERDDDRKIYTLEI